MFRRTLTIVVLVAAVAAPAFGQGYSRRVAPRGYHAAMARSAPRYYVPPVRRTTIVRHHTMVVPAYRPPVVVHHHSGFNWGVVVGAAVAPLVQPRPIVYAAPVQSTTQVMVDQSVTIHGDGNIVQNGSPGPGGPMSTAAVGEHPNLPPGLPPGCVVLEVDYHKHGSDAGEVDEVLVQLPGGATAKFEWENGRWVPD